jgi:hypothetical protein
MSIFRRARPEPKPPFRSFIVSYCYLPYSGIGASRGAMQLRARGYDEAVARVTEHHRHRYCFGICEVREIR